MTDKRKLSIVAGLLVLAAVIVGCAAWRGCEGRAPTVDPPIELPGLHVLVTYDAAGKGNLPREQMALLDSPTFRAYLDAHCAKDGNVPGWRIVPSTAEFPQEPAWQKAMQLPHSAAESMTVSNSKTGYIGALPANEQDATALVEKYAK